MWYTFDDAPMLKYLIFKERKINTQIEKNNNNNQDSNVRAQSQHCTEKKY